VLHLLPEHNIFRQPFRQESNAGASKASVPVLISASYGTTLPDNIRQTSKTVSWYPQPQGRRRGKLVIFLRIESATETR
jgi:hypothetical protein